MTATPRDRSARRWTLVATIVGSSLTFVDATVVNVALPALQADLRATITDVQWIIEAYALFLGSLILVGGSMAILSMLGFILAVPDIGAVVSELVW